MVQNKLVKHMNQQFDVFNWINFEFEIDDEEPVYTSGVVCTLLEIPVWVLKQLDRGNIVSPYRRGGKSRLYSKKDLVKLKYVWYLMEIKEVNVSGVRVILEIEEKIYSKQNMDKKSSPKVKRLEFNKNKRRIKI